MKKKPYVLLIEDSISQALQIQLVLNRAGYEVVTTGDGAEGWHLACERFPDLILLDVNLPIIDGFQVLSLLKHSEKTKNIPVLMLTSMDRINDVDHAVQLGADGYLFKDDYLFGKEGPRRMVEAIDQFLRNRDAE
jgi:DNA-binding response OmpR family regulator